MLSNATGAVLAINDNPEACSGLNPKPIKSAAVTATGVPISGALEECAETEGDEQKLQAAICVIPVRLCWHFKSTRLPR